MHYILAVVRRAARARETHIIIYQRKTKQTKQIISHSSSILKRQIEPNANQKQKARGVSSPPPPFGICCCKNTPRCVACGADEMKFAFFFPSPKQMKKTQNPERTGFYCCILAELKRFETEARINRRQRNRTYYQRERESIYLLCGIIIYIIFRVVCRMYGKINNFYKKKYKN